MQFEYCACQLPLIGASVVCTALGIVTWRRQPAAGAQWFTVVLFLIAEWTLGYALELASVTLEAKIFWAQMEYVGIVLVPVTWFFFASQYTGRQATWSRRTLVLFTILPAITLLLVWTPNVHNLIWRSTELDTMGGLRLLVTSFGPWFWVHSVYSYLLIGAGFVLLVRTVINLPYLYRGQVAALLVGASAPLVGSFMTIFRLGPWPHLDLTPFGFAFGGLTVGWSLFRHRLLDIVPLGRDTVVANMQDGMLILDNQYRIVDYNAAAEPMLDPTDDAIIGRPVADVLSDYAARFEDLYDGTPTRTDVRIEDDGTERYFDLLITPLRWQERQPSGHLITWHDVTALKRTQQELQALNRELDARVQQRTGDLVATNKQLRLEIAERRRVERQLHHREQEFRALAENAPDVIARSSSEGRYVYVNPVVEEITGIPPETFIGHETLGLPVFPPVADLAHRKFHQVLETGQATTFEFEYPAADGTRWFHARVVPEFDPDGNVESVLGIARDITQRKAAEQAIEQRNRELATLLEVGQQLASRLEFDELLDTIAQAIVDVLPAAQASSLWLYGEDRQQLIVQAWAGYDDEAIAGLALSPDTNLADLMFQSQQPQIVHNSADYPQFESLNRPPLDAVQAMMCAPLLRQGDPIGIVTADNVSQKDAFSVSDVRLLQMLASQAVVAIENAHLFEAQRYARWVAETLEAANRALIQTLDLDVVSETLLDYLAQLVPYDAASIILLDSDSTPAVTATRGYERWIDPQEVQHLSIDMDKLPHLRAALDKKQSLLVADTRDHPSWQHTVRAGAFIRSWLGVPLIAGGDVVGLFSVDKGEPGFFTFEHQSLAEALAGQAGFAIYNAQLFEEVHASRERLQALSQQLVALQEAERRKVAYELHEEIAQALTGLQLSLEMSTRQPADAGETNLEEAQALVTELIAEVRKLSADLRPSALDDLGLLPALTGLFRDYTEHTSVDVEFKHTGLEGRRFAWGVETTAYRFVQEALSNAARHAGADTVGVYMKADADRLTVRVSDADGGLRAPELGDGQAGGWANLRERVALVGGDVVIDSAPEAGTTVTIHLPLTQPPHDP